MKKLFILFAVAALNCGVAQAQLSGLLDKAKSAVSNAGKGNSALSSAIATISSKLVPNEKQIVGTWVYQEPAIMLTSNSSLKEYASSVATKSLEQKLQSYLSKIGLKKGNSSITFSEDKNFSVKYGSKALKKGTYTLNNQEVILTFAGKTKPCKVTPQLDNGSLVIVMDATKFKEFMQNISAQVQQLSPVVAAMKQMDGMKIGVRLTKQ